MSQSPAPRSVRRDGAREGTGPGARPQAAAVRLVVSSSALKAAPGALRLDALRGGLAFAAHAPFGEVIALDGRAVRLCDLRGAQARTVAEDVSGGSSGARALCWDPSSGLVAVALPTRVELFLLCRGAAAPGAYSPAQWAAQAATAQLRRLGTVAPGITGLVGLEWGGARASRAPPLLLIATEGGAGALLADCAELVHGAGAGAGTGSPHDPPLARLHALPGAECASGSALTCATWAGRGAFVAAGDSLGCVRVWDLRELYAIADAGAPLASGLRRPALLLAPTGAANLPVSALVAVGRGDLLCAHGQVAALEVVRSVNLAARLSGGLHSFGIEEALLTVGRGRDAPALSARDMRDPQRELQREPQREPQRETRGVLDSLMNLTLPPDGGEEERRAASEAASLDNLARRAAPVDGHGASGPGDVAGAVSVALRAVLVDARLRTPSWGAVLGDPPACRSVRQARLVTVSDCGEVTALAGPAPPAAQLQGSPPAVMCDHVTLLRIGADMTARTVADVAVGGRVRGLQFTPDGSSLVVMLSGPTEAAAPAAAQDVDTAHARAANAASSFFFGGSDGAYELWLTSIAVPGRSPPPGHFPEESPAAADAGEDDGSGSSDDDDDEDDEKEDGQDIGTRGGRPAASSRGRIRARSGRGGMRERRKKEKARLLELAAGLNPTSAIELDGVSAVAQDGGSAVTAVTAQELVDASPDVEADASAAGVGDEPRPRRNRRGGGKRKRPQNSESAGLVALRKPTSAADLGCGVDSAAGALLRAATSAAKSAATSADITGNATSGTGAGATAAAVAAAPSPRRAEQPPQLSEDMLRAVLSLSCEMSTRLARIEKVVAEQGERIARIEAAVCKPTSK